MFVTGFGIFRGAFDVGATSITEGMKVAAASALADLVGDDLTEEMIVPSPFDPRDAQGFRCPVYPWERVVDVSTMLVELLHDCRVTDIRAVAGVHADRDALTGGPLLFKPETIPPSFPVSIH